MSILYDPLTNKQVYYLVDDENAGVTGKYNIVMSTTDFRKFHTRLRYKSQQKPMRVYFCRLFCDYFDEQNECGRKITEMLNTPCEQKLHNKLIMLSKLNHTFAILYVPKIYEKFKVYVNNWGYIRYRLFWYTEKDGTQSMNGYDYATLTNMYERILNIWWTHHKHHRGNVNKSDFVFCYENKYTVAVYYKKASDRPIAIIYLKCWYLTNTGDRPRSASLAYDQFEFWWEQNEGSMGGLTRL